MYQPHYEIHYTYPKFHRRVFANLLDFLCFALCFALLFLGVRAITTVMPGYVETDNELLAIRKDSGLYHVEGKDSTDIVSYLDEDSNGYTGYAKMSLAENAINTFIAYVGNESGDEARNTVQKDYDEWRLDASLTFEGVSYFIKDDEGSIVRNKDACKADNETYFKNVYGKYIDDRCQGYLLTLVPRYLEVTRFESNILLFVEIPVAYLIAGVLVYLVPPLFFKNGRMTLGKFAYQIGLCDSRLLSCTWKRYLARWAIFFFGELFLSLFTFGIPCLVSFSLMAFSKKKQGFPDYMLGLFEVDLSHDKLYRSYEEISVDGIDGDKKPVDFKPTYED